MANCYYLHSSVKKINYDDLPCGDVDQVGHNTTCCVRGSTCMSNGLCQNAGGDGYYSADCTDPTLEDPACQTHCGGFAGAQVVYNSTSKLWACCSYNGGQPNCSSTTDEVFAAPAPADLIRVIQLPVTGSATYSTSKSSATSVPSSSTPSALSTSSSAITPGAAAGIGVGAGVGVILVAGAFAFCFFKRRRQSASNKLNLFDDGRPQQREVSEVESKAIVPELYGGPALHELHPSGRI
ncbi:hypothetical protein PMG11_03448 [Penicillium brasilianum]|uniref:Uncharacterized protein n=1 Tax=Penicillium brasilianum TaxID=104259 RepID=A0A0F7VA35_PENBI|nr:hypothetical protein PMG11_03448 [Penicillium brasilianum]